MKKAFTLAEIMIVLTVIAVLTAILLPSARNAMPSEKIMKFKKGHNTLYTAIGELVNSDKYYLDGDLGQRVGSIQIEDRKYFCQTFSDVINAKFIECSDKDVLLFTSMYAYYSGCGSDGAWNYPFECSGAEISSSQYQTVKRVLDTACKTSLYSRGVSGKQIVSQDSIWYFDAGPSSTFGSLHSNVEYGASEVRVFSPPSQYPPTFYDSNGMDVEYKIFCMDIDGVAENSTTDDCINECPFGYGIRADGKILNGARADEWLAKSIQEKD